MRWGTGRSILDSGAHGTAREGEEDRMGHDKNDELREGRQEKEERRQHHRDETFEETGGVDDEGSQDERREEGLDRL